jgi:hypothetical protein
MKKLAYALLMSVLALGIAGCEDEPEETDNLEFTNASRYTVNVIPLTTEWGGFSLAPGEKRKLNDIRDADFRYEPSTRVQEGSASKERFIVFVDADKTGG